MANIASMFGSTDTTSIGAFGSGLGGIAGLAGGIFSAVEGADIQKQETQVSQAMVQSEMAQQATKLQAMYAQGQREQMQNLRSAQVARSMALTTATGQGSQFGSGLQGAYGGISGQANTNAAGISQNLQFGQQLYNETTQEDALKIQMAGLQGQAATNSAMGGLFGSLGKSGGSIANLIGMIPLA